MFLKIQFENDTPIYEQLQNQIVQGIASGQLKEGESLPSVRQLATDLGINLHTVNKTYNLLKNEGFLVVHRRKNVIVNSYEKMHQYRSLSKLKEHLYPILAGAACRGVTRNKMTEIVHSIYNDFETDKENK
ncbi:MAG: GntR family transcriptional regulator [Fidelibacterota bacterium]